MLKNNFNCCSSISRCERCILIVLGPRSSVRSRNRRAFFPLLLSTPHPLQVMVPNCSVHFVQSQGLRTLWLNIDSVSLVITTSQLLIKYIRAEEGDKKKTQQQLSGLFPLADGTLGAETTTQAWSCAKGNRWVAAVDRVERTIYCHITSTRMSCLFGTFKGICEHCTQHICIFLNWWHL